MQIAQRTKPPQLTGVLLENKLNEALNKAWKSPFMSRKFMEAGFQPGQYVTLSEWSGLPLLKKDELRSMGTESFYRDFVIAPREEQTDFWRSGGVTGQPLFYPRTKEDISYGIESFARYLENAGVKPGDRVAMSYPLGVHPIGRMMLLAIHSLGATVLGTGAGNVTPTEQQIQLFLSLEVDVVLMMGTYANVMANVAAEKGYDLAGSSVKKILSVSDTTTPAKRQRIERFWNAEFYDAYGVSEAGMMSCECELHNGLHLFADLFHVEVLHPETMQPVPLGETGILVVTPLYTNNATPFVRWVTGDYVSMSEGCGCQSPCGHFPLMHLTGRTDGFFKIRGINVNHKELQDVLLSIDEVTDYLITVETVNHQDIVKIEIEKLERFDEAVVSDKAGERVASVFGIRPQVQVVESGSIAQRLAMQIKQDARIFDRR